ncbi:HpcH/HpaI aldolase/citrate lyase family protein [Pseudomonas silvicola]|nr:HpcH/HpaI aldolase/citrate lyase family protein [Pseudomonas silvicola]
MLKANSFKAGLARDEHQFGLWCSLASNITTEILAGAGYDWLTVDMEHSPFDLFSVLGQLQAIAAYDVEALVRLPSADATLIKQLLDLGARSLVFPNIESAQQAVDIVSATRYPPHGIRGMAAIQRANRYGRVPGYVQNAVNDLCLLMQVESAEGVAQAADIAGVDGVDGIFIGPNDLAASLGFIGRADEPVVQDAIAQTIAATRRQGKAVGILAPNETVARRYLDMGCSMVGVGSDQGLLIRAADDLIAKFRSA